MLPMPAFLNRRSAGGASVECGGRERTIADEVCPPSAVSVSAQPLAPSSSAQTWRQSLCAVPVAAAQPLVVEPIMAAPFPPQTTISAREPKRSSSEGSHASAYLSLTTAEDLAARVVTADTVQGTQQQTPRSVSPLRPTRWGDETKSTRLRPRLGPKPTGLPPEPVDDDNGDLALIVSSVPAIGALPSSLVAREVGTQKGEAPGSSDGLAMRLRGLTTPCRSAARTPREVPHAEPNTKQPAERSAYYSAAAAGTAAAFLVAAPTPEFLLAREALKEAHERMTVVKKQRPGSQEALRPDLEALFNLLPRSQVS